MNRYIPKFPWLIFLLILVCILAPHAVAQEPLFNQVGVPETASLPDHIAAAQPVQINRRALQAPTMVIDLFGEQVIAVRERIERHKAGQVVWVGFLLGNPGDAVIITTRADHFSGMIQRGAQSYRLGIGADGNNRLFELILESLPPDDTGDLPDGNGSIEESPAAGEAADNTVQDLLVVYNQAACNSANGCAQLEADIITAVADINSAYAASGVDITLNLAGTTLTNYSGTNSGQALSDIRGTSDGQMDEIHALRDQLGADIVAFIYDGGGCGIGYLGSSASTAFSVTDEPCLVGNRTMAHEIGHNQGAHHDRQTVGGGSNGAYNYGYRRCSNGSVDDFGSPYYRTVLSYSCSSAPRVGRFSNPNVNYLGVPQGVDPAVDPAKGAWNARTLNESASYIAGFRTGSSTTPPNAPSGLSALASGPDTIDLAWSDNSNDENSFNVQSSPDNTSWTSIATLAANTSFFTDDGLLPESLHYYRVRASNSAGSFGFSNVASDITGPLPPSIDDLANADVFDKGTVGGTYTATHASGGSVQTITEQHSGGPKKSRRQAYAHAWTFDVFGGAGGVVASVNASVSGSEGANFYYSLDGGSTQFLMFTVNNSSPASAQTFVLPGGASGPVRIIVEDAAQSNGESVDSVFVDNMFITSYADPGSPPQAPSEMNVTTMTSDSVTMDFMDNSEDEFGFEIWRANADPGPDCSAGTVLDTLSSSAGTGPVDYVDSDVIPNTIYWYWASSFNGAGDNGQCSNAAQGTTTSATGISLTIVRAFRVKGVRVVDLEWTGAGTGNVDVVRDDGGIVTVIPVTNDGAYTDDTGAKGKASIVYKICEENSSSACSPSKTATF